MFTQIGPVVLSAAVLVGCPTTDSGPGDPGGPDYSSGLGTLDLADGRRYDVREGALTLHVGTPNRGLMGMGLLLVEDGELRHDVQGNVSVDLDETNMKVLGRNEWVNLAVESDVVGPNGGIITLHRVEYRVVRLRLLLPSTGSMVQLDVELTSPDGSSLVGRYLGQLPMNCTWTDSGGTVQSDPTFARPDCSTQLDQLGLREEYDAQLGGAP